jgi:hypothetical protein
MARRPPPTDRSTQRRFAELRGSEEGADGLVGRTGVAEAVLTQHEAPAASRHVGGCDEMVGRRRVAAMAAPRVKRTRSRLLIGHGPGPDALDLVDSLVTALPNSFSNEFKKKKLAATT